MLNNTKERFARTLSFTVACIISTLVFMPFVWMVMTSLKPMAEVFTLPPQWLPSQFMWSNYLEAISSAQFGRYFVNSTVVSIVSVLICVTAASMAGYALARLSFPGRQVMFLGILATMMVPMQVNVVPLFVISRYFPLVGGNNALGVGGLGLLDSYIGLILPYTISAFGIFLMRQFFLTLPVELEDAARIDGCTEFQIYWKVMLPLCKPAVATLAIFTFQTAWNDFLWPLIITKTDSMKTLQLGLTIFQQENTTQWNLLMAGTVMASLPVIAIFIGAQKAFTQGIAMSGIKG